MIVELDREKTVTVLQWLVHGCIDTRDIAELRLAQKDVPVKIWLEWEREAEEKGESFGLQKRLRETAGILPETVNIDTEKKNKVVLRWLKHGYIDTNDFEEMEATL